MYLSKATIWFGLFIVISASFMWQVLEFFYASIGKQTTILTLGISFIMIFAAIVWRILGLKIANHRKLLFLIVLALGLYFSWSMKIAAERVHILEYGLLGYLACKDALKDKFAFKQAILILLTITIFAFLDEGFQRILPYRVWDLRDIAFNLTGGAWGSILFLIKRQNSN